MGIIISVELSTVLMFNHISLFPPTTAQCDFDTGNCKTSTCQQGWTGDKCTTGGLSRVSMFALDLVKFVGAIAEET